MYGYHYTSYSNYLKIKQDGLIPYKIINPDIIQAIGENKKGVFMWVNKLIGEDQVGSVFYQVTQRGELKVVLLKCKYSEDEVMRVDGRRVNLTHSGIMGNWKYHPNQPPAVILVNSIAPKDIELVNVWDFNELIK